MAETSDQPDAGDEFRRRIGKNLRCARLLIDENRTRFAAEFGVHDALWMKWENGTALPNAMVMAAFCDRWRFTMDWLYRGRTEGLSEYVRGLLYKAYPDLLEAAIVRPPTAGDRPPAPAPAAAAPATSLPPSMPVRGRKRPGKRLDLEPR